MCGRPLVLCHGFLKEAKVSLILNIKSAKDRLKLLMKEERFLSISYIRPLILTSAYSSKEIRVRDKGNKNTKILGEKGDFKKDCLLLL